MSTSIAIITARGGSKRIPKKNIKEFCGKPIIAYSIEAALASDLFTEVMVSTDDEEIAAVAKKYGAIVPFYRSAKNSDDYATTVDVITEVITEYKNRNQRFDNICCIYPTAPFVTKQKIKEAYDILINSHVEAVVPVVKFSYPIQRSFIINDSKLEYKWPQFIKSRSQDLEECYHDAGQFYFIKSEVLRLYKSLVPENTAPYILNESEVQDIDNIEDWKIAELKYKALNAR